MTNIALGAVDIKDKELNGFYLKNTLLDRNYFLLNATAIFGSNSEIRKSESPRGRRPFYSFHLPLCLSFGFCQQALLNY
jgi:hypothetical protein